MKRKLTAVLALALAKSGQPDAALQAVECALQGRPDDAVALNLAGELYRQKGAWSDAANYYRRILTARPDHAQTHHHLAASLGFLGHTQEAIEHYRQALAANPDEVRLLYNYALTLRVAGDGRGAREALAHALTVDPDHVGARYALLQARLGASLNTALGLEQLICSNSETYQERAVELANQPEELNRLRSRLSEARETSCLFDPAQFARNLETLYRQVWERHRKGEPPASLHL